MSFPTLTQLPFSFNTFFIVYADCPMGLIQVPSHSKPALTCSQCQPGKLMLEDEITLLSSLFLCPCERNPLVKHHPSCFFSVLSDLIAFLFRNLPRFTQQSVCRPGNVSCSAECQGCSMKTADKEIRSRGADMQVENRPQTRCILGSETLGRSMHMSACGH